MKKLFYIPVILLCACFLCLFFTGCGANIESIEIEADGFDKGAGEITVAKDLQSIELNILTTWQENAKNVSKPNITWEFIGDDLGCRIMIIDPGCLKGRLAIVELGEKTGKVILRATAKSKNKVSADLIIWIE